MLKPLEMEPSVENFSNLQHGHVSSTMSMQLFDGDLLDELTTISNILSESDEWVVQSLTEMKDDLQLSFSYFEFKSLDSSIFLVWACVWPNSWTVISVISTKKDED